MNEIVLKDFMASPRECQYHDATEYCIKRNVNIILQEISKL